MNSRRFCSVLLAALLVCSAAAGGLVAAAPHRAAAQVAARRGAPHVVVRPAMISGGGRVMVVAGGFAARERVFIYVSGMGKPVAVARADRFGVVRLTRVMIPYAARAGAHRLVVVGAGGGAAASTVLTVQVVRIRVTVSVSRAVAGQAVLLTARNCAPHEVLIVRLSGVPTPIAVLRASAAGFAVTRLVIPASAAAGLHLLTVTGTTTLRSTAVAFTVRAAPAAQAVPSTAASLMCAATPGSTILFAGQNFAPNEAVTLFVSGVAAPLTVVTATPGGQFVARLTLPTTIALGVHTVTAVGATSHQSVTHEIMVVSVPTAPAPAPAATSTPTTSAPPAPPSPTLAVPVTAITAGSVLVVSGRNFVPNELVTLSLTPISGRPIRLAVVRASAAGILTARVTIPATATAGPNVLAAVGMTNRRAAMVAIVVRATATTTVRTTTVTVTSPGPTLTGATATAVIGRPLTLTLRHFAAGEAITLGLNGLATPLAIVRATTSASLTVVVVIPRNAEAGAHVITAVGALSHRMATFRVRLIAATVRQR